MQIPINGQVTLRKDVWAELEALRLFYGGNDTHKTLVEGFISDMVSELLPDPEFAVILQSVRKEGVTRGKGRKRTKSEQ
jgi:hypothetical protein